MNKPIEYSEAERATVAARLMMASLETMRQGGDVNEWHWLDAQKILRTAVRATRIAAEKAEARAEYDLNARFARENNEFGDELGGVEIDLYQLQTKREGGAK